jgi:dethiobiotin synthetase
MNGMFITGTDTGIGKTLVTAILLRQLIETGREARPMKPVQSGCVEIDGRRVAPDLEFALQFAGLQLPNAEKDILCPYKFLLAASPHLAAEQEGTMVDWQRLLELPHHPAFADQCLLVEGAGGLYVPIDRNHTMLDLIVAYELPVLLVARAGLGTLNHSMLSVDALRARGCTLAAIILKDTTGRDDPEVVRDNRETLSQLASVPVLGPLPHIPALNTEGASATSDCRKGLQNWPGREDLFDVVRKYSRIL